jgi:DNA-binding response OmpR family regulator
VLCIDNEPEILDGMNALLSRWGMKVLTAPDAETALRLAASDRPALVLADHRLADGDPDGLDLLAALCGTTCGAPSGALITADHSVAVAARARELGYPLLRKPLKPAALRALLGALASQRQSVSI